MMPVSRVAAALLLAGAAPTTALAADKPAVNSKGAGTSAGDTYILPANGVSREQERAAKRFYGEYKAPGGVQALRLGIFPGGLKPAAGDSGKAAVTAATHGQASARAGVRVSGSWLRTSLLLALGVLAAATLFGTFFTAPARAALPAGFMGVTAEDVYAGSSDYQDTNLTEQSAVGFTTIRQVFRWQEIEFARGSFDFSATDRFVLNAAKHRIRVLPLLFGEPAWATGRPAGNTLRYTFAPKSNADFAAFAAAIARRYGPGGALWAANPSVAPVPILAYQVWNEPNLGIYWGGKANPTAYAAMVAVVARALRLVQPAAVIVTGGIPDSHLGMAPAKFLKAFLKAGGGKNITAVGVHPYSPTVKGVLRLVNQMRSTLNRFKGGKKVGLWVTEIGWAVGGPPTPGRTVTGARQASLVRSMFINLTRQRARLKLRGIVYFAWRDLPPYPGRTDFWGLRTGLVGLNGQPKPAVAILTAAIKALA